MRKLAEGVPTFEDMVRVTGLWYKIFSMTIELAGTVEEQLRDLATRQGRAIDALLEEAVLQYLEAAAITDLSDEQVAETQLALMGEFRGISAWKDGDA